MKVKNIIETYSLDRESYGTNAIEHGRKLDDLINDFVVNKNVIDIKYDGTHPRSALVMYAEEDNG